MTGALLLLYLWIGIRTIYRKAWAVWSGFLLSMVITANLMASIVIPVIPSGIGLVPEFLRFVAEGSMGHYFRTTVLVFGCAFFTYLLAMLACSESGVIKWWAQREDSPGGPESGGRWL